jgi:sialate O-acetylesterase
MIAPIEPFAMRGATWYQGESNANRAYQYRKLLPAMIKSWRDSWNEGEFPFLIVSLANFTQTAQQPGDSDWAELREAQAMTAAQPHNAQALAIDVGDANDIHPKDKQTVGARLALAARAIAYGEHIEYSGPWYDSMKVEGDAVRINFKHVDSGLTTKGADTLKGFQIAGEDHAWHWADAKIDGSSVVVHSDQVQHPAAVRYAWANNPVCNLYNKDDLPAVPFRTDDWKGVTADAR